MGARVGRAGGRASPFAGRGLPAGGLPAGVLRLTAEGPSGAATAARGGCCGLGDRLHFRGSAGGKNKDKDHRAVFEPLPKQQAGIAVPAPHG